MNQEIVINKAYIELGRGISEIQEKCFQSSLDASGDVDISAEYKKVAFDVTDFGFCVVIGCLASYLTLSKDVKDAFNSVHKDASQKNPQTFLGKILHHKNDPMDMVSDGFKTRGGNTVAAGFHRLRWGHDIFSITGDNPFALMCNKHGLLLGVVKTCRHLLGDLFSVNGLPLPGSSFFDFTSDGVEKNWFQTFSTSISENSSLNAREAYESLFTINIQDIASYGAVTALHKVYVKTRKIDNNTRSNQVLLLSYYIAFFVTAGTNQLRHGVPYVNWPILVGLLKSFATFIMSNYADIARLEEITNRFCKENLQLEQDIFSYGKLLPSYATAAEYVSEINRTERGYNTLLSRRSRR